MDTTSTTSTTTPLDLKCCTLQDTKLLLFSPSFPSTSKILTPPSFPSSETSITLTNLLPKKSLLLITTSTKELLLYKITPDLSLSLLGKIILPKRPTHAFVSKSKYFYWDKYGDINSVQIDDIFGKSDKDNINENLIKEDGNENPRPNKGLILHESGNFCTLTSFYPFKFEEGDQGLNDEKYYGNLALAVSDEYYKIRIFNFPNLHRLKTSISFRKRIGRDELEESSNDLECIVEVQGFDFGEQQAVNFVQNSEEKLRFFVDNQEIFEFGVEEREGGEVWLVEKESVVKAGDESRLVISEVGGDWEEDDVDIGSFDVFEMSNAEYKVVGYHRI